MCPPSGDNPDLLYQELASDHELDKSAYAEGKFNEKKFCTVCLNCLSVFTSYLYRKEFSMSNCQVKISMNI